LTTLEGKNNSLTGSLTEYAKTTYVDAQDATLDAKITQNANNIDANTALITTNKSAIANVSANVTTNATNIAKNVSDIAALQAADTAIRSEFATADTATLSAANKYTDDEIAKLASLSNSNNTIAIWNKIDLLSDTEVANLPQVGVKNVKISALSGLGIEELLDAFEELVWEGKVPQTLPDCAINARAADALEKALFALKLAKDNIEVNELELAAYDLATAAREVGIVTGRTVEPDLLDRVFSNFCIGK
jgi:tRNA modification GTPase